MTLAAQLLAVALAASPPPGGLEVELARDLVAGTALLIDVPWVPDRLTIEPADLAVAASWYRFDRQFVVTAVLPRATSAGERLRVTSRDAARGITLHRTARGVTPAISLPLAEPVAGRVVALLLPPLPAPRALLLRGDVSRAVVLVAGEVLERRAARSRGRAVFRVPAGAAGFAFIAGSEVDDQVTLVGASLHIAEPLPAPESFVVAAGAGTELTFEVPERAFTSRLRFEAFDVAGVGELTMELEGHTVYHADGPLTAGGWSEPIEVTLPRGLLATGRASLLRVYLRAPPTAAARADLGIGVRHLALDELLPAVGPFGSDRDHPGEVQLSFVAAQVAEHAVRFEARGLTQPNELEVLVDDRLLATVDGAAAGESAGQSVLVSLPEQLIQVGRRHRLLIRRRLTPGPRARWSVSAISVAPQPRVPPLPPPPSTARGEGPTPSRAPVGQPGSEPRPGAIVPAGALPALPGQPSEPVGKTDLFFGVPVLEPEFGKPYAPPPAEWAAAAVVEAVRLAPGPITAGAALDGSGGDGLPGQPTVVTATPAVGPRPAPESTPPIVAPPRAELPAAVVVPVPPPVVFQPLPGRGAGTRLRIQSVPAGAAVFLALPGSFRGTFLGVTPLEVQNLAGGPACFRLLRPGYHEASLTTEIPESGLLELSRGLLPWSGIDFSRPWPDGTWPRRQIQDGYLAPAAADLNGDGRVDLVIGGETGAVVWLADTASHGPPRLGPPQPLRKTDGRPLTVGGHAVPAVVDWDGDGRPDILVGSSTGQVQLFRRAVESAGRAFEDRGLLVADGVPLEVGNDAVPLVVDWNGDSIPDLLVGSGYGIIVLYQGTGAGGLTQVAPVTIAGVTLELTLNAIPLDLTDWSGDGIRDLVVADMYGNVWIHPGKGANRPDFARGVRVTHRGGIDLYPGPYPHGFAQDLDGDGFRDLMLGTAVGQLLWYRGGEPGSFDELEPIFADRPAPSVLSLRPPAVR